MCIKIPRSLFIAKVLERLRDEYLRLCVPEKILSMGVDGLTHAQVEAQEGFCPPTPLMMGLRTWDREGESLGKKCSQNASFIPDKIAFILGGMLYALKKSSKISKKENSSSIFPYVLPPKK